MKFQSIIKLSLIASILLAFIACELETDRPPVNTIDKDKILTIADLYQIQADSGNDYRFQGNYNLYATITMDDNSGNIYKEAYAQDETGAINLYRLSRSGILHEGDYVRFNLNNVVLTEFSGKLELIFDAIQDVEKQIAVQKENMHIAPIDVNIEDLQSGEYELKLVYIDSVQFADSHLEYSYYETSKEETDPESGYVYTNAARNRELVDCNGNKITVRSSEYADFASTKVAQGKGSIVGIYSTFVKSGGDNEPQLLIRHIDEVKLDGERCSK